MHRALGPVDSMAASIRVQRYAGESDSSYCARVSYSCARAWVWAACMDDGNDGVLGVTKQALNARVKRWVLAMGELYPDIARWFGVEEGKLSLVYNRMIDVEDIVENDANGLYVAHRPSLARIDANAALVVGAFDLADASSDVCDERVGSTVTTGLCTLVLSDGEEPDYVPPFWETDLTGMEWNRASDVGEVEYFDFASRRWGLRRAESWSGEPTWHEGMSIARIRSKSGKPDVYYLARKTVRGAMLSEVSRSRAFELLLHLRSVSGNRVIARVKAVDSHHARLEGLPMPMLSATYGRYIDALTWPMEGIGDWFNRIVRREALSVIRNLLTRCDVGMREV